MAWVRYFPVCLISDIHFFIPFSFLILFFFCFSYKMSTQKCSHSAELIKRITKSWHFSLHFFWLFGLHPYSIYKYFKTYPLFFDSFFFDPFFNTLFSIFLVFVLTHFFVGYFRYILNIIFERYLDCFIFLTVFF